MKPKIFKRGGQWYLKFAFPVRSFWVFGMNEKEREEVKKNCIAEQKLHNWQNGIDCLKYLYARGEIRLR